MPKAPKLIRQTHTYALMQISPEAYREIRDRIIEAGYQHTLGSDGEIDMQGIAVISDPNMVRPSRFKAGDAVIFKQVPNMPGIRTQVVSVRELHYSLRGGIQAVERELTLTDKI